MIDMVSSTAIDAYAVLFWRGAIGQFDGRTFADHEGEARSVRDTLRTCKRELEEAKSGRMVGLEAALRDMATLKEILNG